MKSTEDVINEFYLKNGICCAGCDNWRFINSVVGECIKSAPAANPAGMLGFESCSIECDAGHVLTTRDSLCGEFKDVK